MSTKEVSRETGVPATTLRYWRHTDQGPASFALGKKVFYRREEIERWIDEQERLTRRGGGDAA